MPDQLYLENLDEFINDENKIVTYKWLSSTLKVHVNQAKQMLYSFMQEQRKKNGSDINVTYFVSGVNKTNGCLTCRCAIVPEDRLETYKKSLSPLTSCHIYSIQKSKLKNSNALYITDYEETKKNILHCNKYSSIQYNKAKARSNDEINKLRAIQQSAGDSEKTVESKVNNGTTTNLNIPNKAETTKKTNKGGIAGMFANASKKQEIKPVVAKEEKNSTIKTEDKTKAKPGTVSNLFSKQRGKKTEKPSPTIVEKKVEDKVKMEVVENKPAKKKKLEESDGDGQKSKRRRIKEDLFDSSSDEEVEMEESPVPSPSRDPSPCPESPVPEPKEDEKVITPEKKSPDNTEKKIPSEKKRRRKRKLVPKTYMDEDGFMVTEKVWESESTDASDGEIETVEPAKVIQKSPAKLPPGKKAPGKKKSPVKASGKQTSMMSFFKKK